MTAELSESGGAGSSRCAAGADTKRITADVAVVPAAEVPSIRLHVGQTLSIARPETSAHWTVDFDRNILTSLTAPDRVSEPGPRGWLFKAMHAGEVRIVLTAAAAPCRIDSPCAAPIPEKFTIDVRVEDPHQSGLAWSAA